MHGVSKDGNNGCINGHILQGFWQFFLNIFMKYKLEEKYTVTNKSLKELEVGNSHSLIKYVEGYRDDEIWTKYRPLNIWPLTNTLTSIFCCPILYKDPFLSAWGQHLGGMLGYKDSIHEMLLLTE